MTGRRRRGYSPSRAARGRKEKGQVMSFAVAIQMDPIENIDINADSTFALALEAQRRGSGLFHYLPQDLVFKNGRLYARVRPLEVRRERSEEHTSELQSRENLVCRLLLDI